MVKANCKSHRVAGGDANLRRVCKGIDPAPERNFLLDSATSLYEPKDVMDGGSEGFAGD